MKRLITIGALVGALFVGSLVVAQTSTPADPWGSWRFLIGEWVSEGPKDQSTGSFSFAFDLQEKILIRKNHADVPAAKDRPATSHDDLMIVYHGNGPDTRAIYFDNEGHRINYAASFSKDGSALTFLSDKITGAPRFRLGYVKRGKDSVNITFEIAQPSKPEVFETYLSGSAHRK